MTPDPVEPTGLGKRILTAVLGKRGFTLIEVLVAVMLSFLVATGAWSLISIHSRGSLEAVATADRLDATRIVRGILETELERGLEGRDWTLFDGDSLTVRGFRGVAVPCGPAAGGMVRVLVRSVRRPDPAKDSVLLLFPEGRWEAVDLQSATPTSLGAGGGSASVAIGVCASPGPDETLEDWTVSGLDGAFVVARIFERGSYHLVDDAFRYRIGAGGRQPLTQALFDPRESGLDSGSAASSVLRLRLGFRDPGSSPNPPPAEMRLWLPGP